MKIRIMMTAACALAIAAGTAVVRAADDTNKTSTASAATVGKPQTLCPIMKEPIIKKLFVDYQGKRIYVCCRSCIKIVQKDPEKYIKQMEAEGIVLEKVPEKGDAGGKARAESATDKK